MAERTIKQYYPSSGLKPRDFRVDEIVVIIDPRGRKNDYLMGRFDIGDQCRVINVGAECLTVEVIRTGTRLESYSYRFDKNLNAIRLQDKVQVVSIEKNGQVIRIEKREVTVLLENKLETPFYSRKCMWMDRERHYYITTGEENLKLIGRKKLL